ncbi:MAG: hypothetical protein JO052_08665 [Bradyrhizobium sp.]|nr:hypothetical protein [Bradyrhizobium sp.]
MRKHALISIDGTSGAVLSFRRYAAASLGEKLVAFLAALNAGEIGGIYAQLVELAAMLGVVLLGASGLASFLGKRIRLVPFRRWRESRT